MILLAGLAIAVSAQGFRGHHSGRGAGPGMAGTMMNAEEVTYTGRIRLVQGEMPTLLVNNERYSLRFDPTLAGEIRVSDNATVDVTGYLRELRSLDLLSEERIIHVRSIEIEGTRYVSTGGMHGHRDSMRGSGPSRTPSQRPGGRW
ncbi:MAG: hypothetical protein EA427_09970 [Spirochaetaceae bacterium]|nr:MAG: hypothetical protein EA427_09970 [Spirochaetaceae bacterium]